MVSALILVISACGGSKSSSTTVSVTITPTSATVLTNQNQQFQATVTGGSTTVVTWEVNGAPFGNATIGTINSGGLYTAPLDVPNPASVTIAAVPVADTSKSATATVTIKLGPNLAISPSSLTMAAGAQQAFTVTSNGTAATNVAFSLSCKSTATGACGSVTTDGVFTAPLAPPPGGNVILTATQTENGSTFSTSATITVQLSAQSLSGQYAFTLAGTDNGTPFHAAGTLTFNGSGSVSAGTEDVNSQGTTTTVNITGGTYTFSATDNRLTVDLQTDHGIRSLRAILANRTHGFVADDSAGVSASGTMDLQDSTKFTQAAVAGNYTFRISGLNTSSPPHGVGVVGAFTADGAGNISSGLLDANDNGTQSSNQSLTGTYTAPSSSNGRGTLTLTSGFGTQTFTYFVVDGSRFKMVETDSSRSTAGDSVLQQNGPYSTASFQGAVAFVMSGTSGSSALGIGGLINLSGGNVSSGNVDANGPGAGGNGQAVTGGTYTVQDATTGRTQMTITLGGRSVPVVFYPESDSAYNVLETDATEISSGEGLLSSGTASGNGTLQGNYAAHLSGVNVTAGNIQQDVVGQLVANGGGVFTGAVDVTGGGAGTTLLSSPYSIGVTSTATLRSGFANFNNLGFNLYIIDGTRALFLENDSNGVLTGELQKQQ